MHAHVTHHVVEAPQNRGDCHDNLQVNAAMDSDNTIRTGCSLALLVCKPGGQCTAAHDLVCSPGAPTCPPRIQHMMSSCSSVRKRVALAPLQRISPDTCKVQGCQPPVDCGPPEANVAPFLPASQQLGQASLPFVAYLQQRKAPSGFDIHQQWDALLTSFAPRTLHNVTADDSPLLP